jgi:hypothetical protein
LLDGFFVETVKIEFLVVFDANDLADCHALSGHDLSLWNPRSQYRTLLIVVCEAF